MKHLQGILLVVVTLFLIHCKEEEPKTTTPDKLIDIDQYNIEKNELSEEEKQIILNLELTPVGYVSWINNNGSGVFRKDKKISEFNYSMSYLPVDYMICNDLKKETISQKELDSLRLEYEGMEYYKLQIQIDDFNDETAKYLVSDFQEYQERIVYMSFGMQGNLTALINGEKEVQCGLYHFERTYGVAPYATFLFGFSKEDLGSDVKERTIIFEDNLFFKGLIKFNWTSDEVSALPKVKVL